MKKASKLTHPSGWNSYFKRFVPWVIYGSIFLLLASFVIVVKVMAPPELTTQTWPAGTLLSNIDRGGRINTFHRGYMMFGAMGGTSTWDISNPANPQKVHEVPIGDNGHRWWKINDLFYREYSVPELGESAYKYLDLSNMLDRGPVTSSDALFTVFKENYNLDKLETYPHTIEANRIYDMRSGEQVGELNIPELEGINHELKVRIGNMIAYTPSNGASGVACFDIGDPSNPKLLDVIDGIALSQYTTTVHVWKHYFIFMNGDNSNEGDNNLVAIDFSDPTDLKYAFGVKLEDSPGRYMFFQDEYGFTGRFGEGVKLNMETLEVETRFESPTPSMTLLDFQWIPIGHILVASGADSNDGVTYFFSHSEQLDTRPPTVAYHNPSDGQVNLPVTSTIGFVINETLDDTSLTDEHIQVSPVGGDPIAGVVTSTSYQVVNFVPKEALLPNTTYEVKFVSGGVKDAVGNGMEEYSFYFSTGDGMGGGNQSPQIANISTSPASPITISTTVGFTVSASDTDGDPLTYRWDFGDGSLQTSWSASGATVSHTYLETGNYTVLVQISDGQGGFVSKGTSVSITENLSGNLPTQSSQILVDANLRKTWTVNTDNNSVTIIDADNLATIDEISVGAHPTSIALDGMEQIWVTCRDDDEVYVIDARTGALIDRIQFHNGSRPFSIVFNPAGTQGYVAAFESGEITSLDPLTRTLGSSINVPGSPAALAITGDGSTLLATRFISPNTEGQVFRIGLGTFTLENTVSLPIDTQSVDNGTTGRGLPNYLSGLAIHPDNTQAYAVGKKDNILRGLSRDDQPLVFENTVRTAICSIDLTSNTENSADRIDIDNHSQPSAALYSPTGNHLFVTMQGNNRLVVIDPNLGKEVVRRDVGLAPQGLALDPVTQKLFVKNFMSRSVTVFDAADMINQGQGSLTELSTIATVGSETLTSEVLKGKQLFYNSADSRMSLEGYISCATCHIDGSEDGQTWDFTDRGEGLRNTISLRGRAGTGHGRVHWSANFDEIQDFENDIRAHFLGSGLMSDADFNEGTRSLSLGDSKAGVSPDLDALVAYVESLNSFSPSPHRNSDGSLTSDAISGKALFTNLKCGSCHSSQNFTDSNNGLLHDVGTISSASGSRLGAILLGIDAPTLRDLWKTPPYLHDGSAQDLEEVLTNAHGGAGTLTAAEKEQLVAYLLQIDESESPSMADGLTVEMTSPTSGTVISAQGEVLLAVQSNVADISKVAYYVNSVKVDEVSTAPFEGIWNPIQWNQYTLQAKVYYNGGATASVTPEVKVTYKRQLKALFVVSDLIITGDELKIKNRLERQLGLEVTVIDDDDAERPSDANPYDLVVMSTTVDPQIIGQDFESIMVPALILSQFIYPNMKLSSGTYGDTYGETPVGTTSVSIVGAGHPLAGGFTADVALYQIPQHLPFGTPSGGFIAAESAGHPVVFGLEEGDDVTSRRTAFPIKRNFLHLFTEEGWELFDAAAKWTIYGGDRENTEQALPDIRIDAPANGGMVNLPFNVEFTTENWTLPDENRKLRLLIDGNDRGMVTTESPIEITNNLSLGTHTITLKMERRDNSPMNLEASVTVIVTDEPVPTGPGVVITSPLSNSFVKPDFDVTFVVNEWEVAEGSTHLRYFIDNEDQGARYTTNPIVIQGLAVGWHNITIQLAEEDQSLTEYTSSIDVLVDTSSTLSPGDQVYVEYRDGSSGSSSMELKPILKMVNNSEGNVFYSDLSMRYWYTREGSNVGSTGYVDYALIGSSSIFTEMVQVNENDFYIAFTFSSDAGVLVAGEDSGPIQMRIAKNDWSTQDQSNDYSYAPFLTSFSPHAKVTLYQNGNLIWGIEPDGVSVGENHPPLAVATASSSTGMVPFAVNFDANSSTDPDGDALLYSWDFGDGITSAAASTTHTYSSIGTYVVVLTVSDGEFTHTATLSISVTDSPPVNQAPVATATASPLTGTSPLTVSFNGDSSSDPDGDPLTYSWDFGDGNTGTTASASNTYSAIGSYTATLTVSDGELTSDPFSLFIEVIESGTGENCQFGTPTSTPLPTTGNVTYNNIYVLGAAGPDLSNVNSFTINWDLSQNGLWEISMQTNNGNPAWWTNLLPVVTHTLGSTSPGITFANSGFSGLDGAYYAALDGDHLTFVSQDEDFSIYFSNSITPPECGTANTRMANVQVTEGLPEEFFHLYPNPSEKHLNISFLVNVNEPTSIALYNIQGKLMISKEIKHVNQFDSIKLSVDQLGSGVYILKIQNSTYKVMKKVVRK